MERVPLDVPNGGRQCADNDINDHDGTHLGLHWKPLNAAIGQVPAPYRPGSHHGR